MDSASLNSDNRNRGEKLEHGYDPVFQKIKVQLNTAEKTIERLEIRLEERDYLIDKLMEWNDQKKNR